MPASNIETLYQFEDALESAAKSILVNAAGLTSEQQRSTATLATPFAIVQASGITAGSKQYKTGANGFNWPIDFSCTLTVVVTTNRQENAASHASYLGKVRRHFYDLTNWSDARLPYHKVALVSEQGTSPSYTEDERFDVSTMTFRLMFFIKDGAWPA